MATRKAQPQVVSAGSPVPARIVETPAPPMDPARLAPASIAPPADPRFVYVQATPSGSSGTKVFGGYFSEEYLTNELSGTDAADQYDRMRRSDAKVKMCLNAVKSPIIAANWEVEPATTDNPDHALHAKFIDHVLFRDMDRPFSKTEFLSVADFGHAVFEVTHKPVFGHPIFGDYIGLASLGWRSPRSILYWRLDPRTGDIDHIRQLISGDLQRSVDIPGTFLLVSSIEKEGDLYEGVSLLRASYGAWKRKNLNLRLMAIGIERNAVPMPTGEIPEGMQNTQQEANFIANLQNYTSHQNAYMTWPAGWKVGFLASNFDPEKIIRAIDFENTEIVSAFMANFLLLGSTQSGSRAVSMDQSEFFLGGIQYVADESVSAINHKLIPQLIKMKYGPQEAYPRLRVSGISDKAGIELANALRALTEGQVIQPDDHLEEHVRRRFQLPKKSDKGVRIVQAPSKMQQGDNVKETDNPQALEAKAQKQLQAAERTLRRLKKKALRLAEDDEEDTSEKLRFVASPGACDECQSYDGEIYYVDDDLPDLPIHPNCECELVDYSGRREPGE